MKCSKCGRPLPAQIPVLGDNGKPKENPVCIECGVSEAMKAATSEEPPKTMVKEQKLRLSKAEFFYQGSKDDPPEFFLAIITNGEREVCISKETLRGFLEGIEHEEAKFKKEEE